LASFSSCHLSVSCFSQCPYFTQNDIFRRKWPVGR